MEIMKVKYYSLILSVIGIIILYLISTFSHPAIINLYEMPNHEGKQVTTKGIVTNYYSTKYGSQIITIEDNTTSATVFLEGEVDLEYGDEIQVTGEVQKYKDKWEIIVDDKKSIKLIKKWQNKSTPLWEIANNPLRYNNVNVNVTGYIDSIFDNYFYLADEKGEYSLIVFYDIYNKNLTMKKKVNVSGVFEFDKNNFKYVLKTNPQKNNIYSDTGD